jgi:Flp pilus assembly protein TadG
MKLTSPHKRKREHGTQLLELAVAMPLLLLFAMIVIEAASFVRAHQVINNAAREGARIATMPDGKDYLDTASQTNVLGVQTACRYLNFYKGAFAGWGGDASCGAPFQITVQPVNPGDPDEILVDSVDVPSTRAIVQYQYTFRYMPRLAFFASSPETMTIKAKAQFRNMF